MQELPSRFFKIKNAKIRKDSLVGADWAYEGMHFKVSLFLISGHTLTFIVNEEELDNLDKEIFGEQNEQ